MNNVNEMASNAPLTSTNEKSYIVSRSTCAELPSNLAHQHFTVSTTSLSKKRSNRSTTSDVVLLNKETVNIYSNKQI